ncbi:hypothetical protein BCEP4_110008 [Burkholderia cepacia]|nr:hypothetical protein BCEP4_110008 [Burkholderia cepacia]
MRPKPIRQGVHFTEPGRDGEPVGLIFANNLSTPIQLTTISPNRLPKSMNDMNRLFTRTICRYGLRWMDIRITQLPIN